MIQQLNDLFVLETNHTSYLFSVLPSKHLEHLHYGAKVEGLKDCLAITEKMNYPQGNSLSYSTQYPNLGLENKNLEMSSYGKGDIREPFVELRFADGSTTCDFLYEKSEISQAKSLKTLPCSYDEDHKAMQLDIYLKEAAHELTMILSYKVYEDSDVITRSTTIVNHSSEVVQINRCLSTQLDFDDSDFMFTNFTGAWVREMNRNDHECLPGVISNSSYTGTSSNRNNPFVMLAKKQTTEDYGDCYGINLVYSGNHYEAAQVDSSYKLRLVSGINPTGFAYQLRPNEEFEAPEAVMAYSQHGFTGMSHCMHHFVRNHIVRGEWKKKQRPVLLNSWEAAYFKFDEGKLLKMAKDAKDLGIELFVLDDGWFGKRDDDKTSLGDWTPNLKKLPGGVKRLADKINALGLEFGIWVEPEMVSEDSDCYRAHPDWAVKIPNQAHSFGRNQMILDLTKSEVVEYVKEQLSNLFQGANISYVKWDMNRIFSDYYSNSLAPNQQGEFAHRYVQGLYQILGHVQTNFPHILLEGCASGGNRFDLGMLCYAPQIWASDNTDPICRAKIQTGYSYGYPMSVVTAHVSDSPNHQTLRNTPMDTRYQVACFGLLGYECNLGELQKEDRDQITGQIELYKKHRQTLQFGDYYRLSQKDGRYQWMVVAQDQSEALGLFLQELVTPNYCFGKFKTKGLAKEKQYHFYNRPMKFNIKELGSLVNLVAPIHIKNHSIVQNIVAKVVKLESEKEDYIVSGSVLNEIGLRLKQGFACTGYDENVRFFQDFGSRLYIMEEAAEKVNKATEETTTSDSEDKKEIVEGK